MRKLALIPLLFLSYANAEEAHRRVMPTYTVYSHGQQLFYDFYSNGTLNVYCFNKDCTFLEGVDGVNEIKSEAVTKKLFPSRSTRRWYNREFDKVKRLAMTRART